MMERPETRPVNEACKRDLEAERSGDDTEDFADGNTDQAIFTIYPGNIVSINNENHVNSYINT